jgi:hypothetical protein
MSTRRAPLPARGCRECRVRVRRHRGRRSFPWCAIKTSGNLPGPGRAQVLGLECSASTRHRAKERPPASAQPRVPGRPKGAPAPARGGWSACVVATTDQQIRVTLRGRGRDRGAATQRNATQFALGGIPMPYMRRGACVSPRDRAFCRRKLLAKVATHDGLEATSRLSLSISYVGSKLSQANRLVVLGRCSCTRPAGRPAHERSYVRRGINSIVVLLSSCRIRTRIC